MQALWLGRNCDQQQTGMVADRLHRSSGTMPGVRESFPNPDLAQEFDYQSGRCPESARRAHQTASEETRLRSSTGVFAATHPWL